jgi:hypothetical protein
MFSVITNIYTKKTKGPNFMDLFTATGKLKKFFFLATRGVRYVPPLPRDLAVSLAQIIAAVKNIDAPMLTRVFQTLNIESMCAVSPVVHTSNISSCQKKPFLVFLWL